MMRENIVHSLSNRNGCTRLSKRGTISLPAFLSCEDKHYSLLFGPYHEYSIFYRKSYRVHYAYNYEAVHIS